MLDGYQPGDPVVRVFAYQADPRAGGGGDRRGGVRDLQRPPGGPRRRGPGLRLLRAQAAVAVGRRRRGRRSRRGGTARRRQGRLDPGPRPADRGPHQRARHPPAPAAWLRAGQQADTRKEDHGE